MKILKFINRLVKSISSTSIVVAILLGISLASAVLAEPDFLSAEIEKLENKLPVLMWQAQLKDVEQDNLTVTWRHQDYLVKLTPLTKLLRRDNRIATLDEFKVGDYLQIAGRRLDKNAVAAKYIHNSSLAAGVKNIIGLINNLDVAGKRFTLDSSTYGSLAVNVSGPVKILERGQEKKLSDLTNGQKVIIRGWLDKSQQLISGVQKIVIFPD